MAGCGVPCSGLESGLGLLVTDGYWQRWVVMAGCGGMCSGLKSAP